ncbi:M20/M25/M40 family metallo-hydrolase, partial [Candidatus Micrarchaeota archaeon]|nr:M20/M25/M40 family metallo-hydrolase [Candidatus Micrarchaeota archaeon]MBU1939514.1 M20/M25/M40 family metallo-hydrolase [Candidatus Micrarchaeota archaeon]
IKYLSARRRRTLKADMAIVLDSKLRHIGNGCSGVIWGKLKFRGTQGHAAYYHRNENILENVLPFLKDLTSEYRAMRETRRSQGDASNGKYPKVWGRFALTFLHAGYKTNIIPGQVVAGFDIRALPEENVRHVMREFRSYVREKLKSYNLQDSHATLIMRGSNGYLTDRNSPFILELKKTMRGLTGDTYKAYAALGGDDGRFIARMGIPVASLGPGGRGAHSEKERITLGEIALTREMIKRTCAYPESKKKR